MLHHCPPVCVLSERSDTYNEMNPPTDDPTYLASVSSAVYKSMATVDPDAVWMMQGWLFVSDPGFWQPAQVEAYLGSVPNNKMIILDLMSDVDPVSASLHTQAFRPSPCVSLRCISGTYCCS